MIKWKASSPQSNFLLTNAWEGVFLFKGHMLSVWESVCELMNEGCSLWQWECSQQAFAEIDQGM